MRRNFEVYGGKIGLWTFYTFLIRGVRRYSRRNLRPFRLQTAPLGRFFRFRLFLNLPPLEAKSGYAPVILFSSLGSPHSGRDFSSRSVPNGRRGADFSDHPCNVLIPSNLAIFHFWAKRKKLYYKNMTLRTFWTHDPKKIFWGGRDSNRSPRPYRGILCNIQFFRQTKHFFQTNQIPNSGYA